MASASESTRNEELNGGNTNAKKELLALNLRNACLLQGYEHVHGIQERKSVREVLRTLAFRETFGCSYRLRAAEALQYVIQRRSRNDTVIASQTIGPRREEHIAP